jgi:hypothetical protein
MFAFKPSPIPSSLPSLPSVDPLALVSSFTFQIPVLAVLFSRQVPVRLPSLQRNSGRGLLHHLNSHARIPLRPLSAPSGSPSSDSSWVSLFTRGCIQAASFGVNSANSSRVRWSSRDRSSESRASSTPAARKCLNAWMTAPAGRPAPSRLRGAARRNVRINFPSDTCRGTPSVRITMRDGTCSDKRFIEVQTASCLWRGRG